MPTCCLAHYAGGQRPLHSLALVAIMRLAKLFHGLSLLLVHQAAGLSASHRNLANQDHQEYLNDLLNNSASSQFPAGPIDLGHYPTNAMLAQGVHLPAGLDQEDAFYSIGDQTGAVEQSEELAVSEPMLLQSLGWDLAKPVAIDQANAQKAPIVNASSLKSSNRAVRKPLVVSSLKTRALASRSKFEPPVASKQASANPNSHPRSVQVNQLLPPVPALFSAKTTSNQPNTSRSMVSRVEASQIEELLRRLKPLSSSDVDPDENIDDFDMEELDRLRREKKLKRVLPTSHLFGGLLGVVNNSLLDTGREQRDSFSTDLSDDRELDALLAGIDYKLPAAESNSDSLIDLRGLSEKRSLHNEKHSQVKERPLQELELDHVEAKNSIPIELLVDQLMSNSRVSFLNTRNRLPEQAENEAAPGEEDDEEEDADDDHDNNDTLPSEAAIDSSESTVHETRVEAPNEAASVSFSSVANRSDSWVPLNSIPALNFRPAPLESSRVEKRRRRSRKDKRGGLNLVVGDRVLSRMDLIRLIRILNRMASKREPSAEREASRNLLRFLVKLALDEHRKSRYNSLSDSRGGSNKTGETNRSKTGSDDDPIWEFLRSILASPIESDGSNTSSIDKSSIKLLPLKTPLRSKTDESSYIDSAKSPKFTERTKLDKLSDDLEQYFDSDFYEDLADQTSARKNGSDRVSVQHRRELRSYPRAQKVSRARRPGYRLPVPVYNSDLEAADEDDVELDHVRLKKSASRPKKSRNNQGNRRIGRRRDQTSAKEPDHDDEPEDQNKRDEEPDPDESDGEESKDDKSRRRSRVKSSQSDKKRDESRDGRKSAKQDDDSSVDEDEHLAHDDHHVNETNQTEPAASERNMNDRDLPETESEREQIKRRRRRRRRRKKKVDDDVDIDSRDEIPAPIVAGRMATRSDTKNETKTTRDFGRLDLENNYDDDDDKEVRGSGELEKKKKKRKYNEKRMKTKAGGEDKTKKLNKRDKSKVSGLAKATSETSAVAPRKANVKRKTRKLADKGAIAKRKRQKVSNEMKTPKRQARSKSTRTERKKKMLNGEEDMEDEPKDMGYLDYYQEGTSYSRICDDDGKCKVKVESSSPGLGKAIKTGDKPAIEKHLGKWMSEPD